MMLAVWAFRLLIWTSSRPQFVRQYRLRVAAGRQAKRRGLRVSLVD